MQLRNALRIGIHVAAWLTIAYIVNQVFRLQFRTFHLINGHRIEHTEVRAFPELILVALFFKAAFFYSNALPPIRVLFRRKEWSMYLAVLFMAGLLCAAAEWLFICFVISDSPPIAFFIWPDLLGYLVAFGISLAFFLLMEWDRNERLAQQAAAEQAKVELDFLKAQINPHFFFNTLNNLYSMAQARDVEELEEGILQLAEMMRYILYECRADRVPLLQELAYIKAYIGLTLARYRSDGRISVEVDANEDELQDLLIAPVLLIPFVENAFKHGVSLEKPSAIHIQLGVKKDYLTFSVKNTDHRRSVSEPDRPGIGNANVKRRLVMLYPERHILRLSDENGYYTVNLQLNL